MKNNTNDKFKVHVIGNYHHKLIAGMKMMCNYLDYDLTFNGRIIKPDIIMSPGYTKINNFKNVIYGPQFSTFPDHRVHSLDHGIYIQPSKWAKEVWDDVKNVPLEVFPFPVNMEKFNEVKSNKLRDQIIVYYKHRHPDELKFIIEKLKNKNIEPIIFDYEKRYKEEDYLNTLHNAKYMVVVAGHESQGFGLQEAMSCNVPLLVWNVKSMNQEYGRNYDDIPASTVPYWDNRCGEVFYQEEEFDETFDNLTTNLDDYIPRKYIEENLSIEKCSEIFISLINKLNDQ